ncbi:MAG: hypothetical protein LBQ34_03905 [Alphaproteobacteria bacterium]|nr:hypothetical protein [Alphaproteobacteria bacterium]
MHFHWSPTELWNLSLSDVHMWHNLLIERLE